MQNLGGQGYRGATSFGRKKTTQELQGTATRMVARALRQLIIICVCIKNTGMTQAKLKAVCKKPSLD